MAKIKRIYLLAAGAWIVLCALFSGGRLEAKDRFILEDDRVFISGDAGLEETGRILQRAYPEVVSDLEHVLGWKLIHKPFVLLIGDREEFERMVEHEPIAAFAIPRRHLVVLGLPMVERQQYLLLETFKHELCHLLLHDHIPEGLPKWLDEGVCQWVSGSLGELMIGREGGLAGPVDLARQAVPLSSLEDAFPGGKQQMAAAYEQSRSMVDAIVSGYGKMGLLGILDGLERGESIEEAVLGSLGKPLSAVESQWRESLSMARVWLVKLGEYFYDILFFLAAVVTGVGGLVAVGRRKRRRLEEMDEEDEGDDEDGEDMEWDEDDEEEWEADEGGDEDDDRDDREGDDEAVKGDEGEKDDGKGKR